MKYKLKYSLQAKAFAIPLKVRNFTKEYKEFDKVLFQDNKPDLDFSSDIDDLKGSPGSAKLKCLNSEDSEIKIKDLELKGSMFDVLPEAFFSLD